MKNLKNLTFCFLISIFTSICNVQAQAQSDKSLTKKIIGTWLLQGMSFDLDKSMKTKTSAKEWDEYEKQFNAQQATMGQMKQQIAEKVKNRMAFTFEKDGKFTFISVETHPAKLNTGTWSIKNAKLDLKSEDKALLENFQNAFVRINKDKLEIFMASPEEKPSPMMSGFECKKGALKDVDYSVPATETVKPDGNTDMPDMPVLSEPEKLTVASKKITNKNGKSCYNVKRKNKDWEKFEGEISNFSYEEGYEYVIEAKEINKKGEKAYNLLKVISKTKK